MNTDYIVWAGIIFIVFIVVVIVFWGVSLEQPHKIAKPAMVNITKSTGSPVT